VIPDTRITGGDAKTGAQTVDGHRSAVYGREWLRCGEPAAHAESPAQIGGSREGACRSLGSCSRGPRCMPASRSRGRGN